jgi:hypothetical protein
VPWSRVLSSTDPFAYQSAFRSVDVDLLPAAKGKFRAELTQINMSWRSLAIICKEDTAHQSSSMKAQSRSWF